MSEHLFPREYDWRISLVDDPSNANACCYPGGKIVIYTGILDMVDFAVEKGICKSKHDALAVILSHEIGHALARHTAESMSYLPLMYLQMILGLESPLLQYVFQFGKLSCARHSIFYWDTWLTHNWASHCCDSSIQPAV